ncbi:MAG: hypothetical protein VKO26_06635 [Cyanobacteriota bacterium]|nr:hypothetical protein [Cyanobacteriota bacterium]
MVLAARSPLKPPPSEKGVGTSETRFLQEALPTSLGLRWRQTPPPLQERHLRRQVAALTDFHAIKTGKKFHKIGTAVTARTSEPEGMGHAEVTSPFTIRKSILADPANQRVT